MNGEDYKAVGEIKNQWVETKDEYLDMALNVIDNLKIKNKQLKDVIEETKIAVDYMIGNADISEIHGTKLKQILDKVSDSDE